MVISEQNRPATEIHAAHSRFEPFHRYWQHGIQIIHLLKMTVIGFENLHSMDSVGHARHMLKMKETDLTFSSVTGARIGTWGLLQRINFEHLHTLTANELWRCHPKVDARSLISHAKADLKLGSPMTLLFVHCMESSLLGAGRNASLPVPCRKSLRSWPARILTAARFQLI